MTAIQEGIRLVGVGKAGSKDCSAALAEKIACELRGGLATTVERVVFFTGLFRKGLHADENPIAAVLPNQAVMNSAEEFLRWQLPALPADIHGLANKILVADTLSYVESRRLGDYLFSEVSTPDARALIATALRIRHAETDEYAGIIAAIEAIANKTLQNPYSDNRLVVQLGEPFDGVSHSHLLTYVLARHLVRRECGVISLVGENPGPKQGVNSLQLAEALNVSALPSVSGDNPYADHPYGYYLRTEQISPRFAEWTTLRRQMLKRPFLATLEKCVNPLKAHVLISSIYHPTFKGRLGEIAQRAGFKASIVAFRSVEGGLGLSLARACNVACTIQSSDGNFIEEKIVLTPEELGIPRIKDEALDHLSPIAEAALTKSFVENGSSGDPHFDCRAKFTLAVYDRALDWMQANWHRSLASKDSIV